MPDFDDHAAAFFGITILVLYLVPATISIVSTIRSFKKDAQKESFGVGCISSILKSMLL
jgi:hypothetical protein